MSLDLSTDTRFCRWYHVSRLTYRYDTTFYNWYHVRRDLDKLI